MDAPNSLRQKQELLGEWKANNQLAFSKLYDQYAPILLGVITKIVSDKREATVLLEVAFVKIRSQLDEFLPSKQPLFVWLLQIARHTALDALNERRRLNPSALQLTNDGKVISPAWQKTTSTVLTHKQMPSGSNSLKALLDMVLFKNCTPEEAARSLGIPVETVRQQLRLAMKQVRNSGNK